MSATATLAADPVQDVLSRLKGVRQQGDQWEARCPAHDDRHASLSVSRGADGRVLLHCHAGCSPIEIVGSLNLRLSSLFPPRENRESRRDKIVATYDYRDAGGTLLYQVVRFDPKGFRQRRPDGNGGWVWKMDGVERVLYRLPELLAADPAAWVFVVEGEKDVDALVKLGLVATCNPGGAGKWGRVSDTSAMAGRRVCVIADADEPGRAHAADIARSIQGKAAEVRVMELPGAKDAAEWIAAGGTAEALLALMEAAQAATATAAGPSAPDDGRAELCTDLGNSERLVRHFGARLKHTPALGWLVYDGQRWAPGDATATELTKESHRRIWAEAAAASDPDNVKRLAGHAVKSQSAAKIEAAMKMARTIPAVAARPGDFDRDPWTLNVANGTLDLETGQLLRHSPGDMLTRIAPVSYLPDAEAPIWIPFLNRVMGGNAALVDWLQKAVGYSLTGRTDEHAFLFLHGGGRNGKSTFCGALLDLLGEYACKIPAESLLTMRRSGGEASPDVARLAGVRLVIASELPENARLNEALVKDLTGGDTITARHLYREPFDFRPVFKLWFYGNHKPVIRGTDEGIWRRPRMLPFTVQIPEAEVDRALPDKLRAELPGILAWAVKGCRRWQAEGLGIPAEVRAATGALRAENDVLGAFLAECCVLGSGLHAPAGRLYAAYRGWAEDGKEYPISQTRFGLALKERGFEGYRDRTIGRLYKGLAVR